MKPLRQLLSRPVVTVAAILSFSPAFLKAQQQYDDAEGSKLITYAINRGARIDSAAANPASDEVNASQKCIKYTRSRTKYDCLHLYPLGSIGDVSHFASHEEGTPKMKIKVFTTAPVGTLIELQLCKKSGVPYPEGTHSQYQARTTVSNAWQELEFNFSQSPQGSKTAPGEIEFVTLLFSPNTLSNHTFYFDELTGPGISKTEMTAKVRKRK